MNMHIFFLVAILEHFLGVVDYMDPKYKQNGDLAKSWNQDVKGGNQISQYFVWCSTDCVCVYQFGVTENG